MNVERMSLSFLVEMSFCITFYFLVGESGCMDQSPINPERSISQYQARNRVTTRLMLKLFSRVSFAKLELHKNCLALTFLLFGSARLHKAYR